MDTGTDKDPRAIGNGSTSAMQPADGPQLSVPVPVGERSAGVVRDLLSEVAVDVDRVVLEQIAVLIGALTSGDDRTGAPASSPFDLRLWSEPGVIRVELHDPEFARHRSEGGLVELDRSLVTGWRLKLIERLADRWSVDHDGELTLRFEFDSEPPPNEELGEEQGNLVSVGELRSPIGGWDFLSGNGRSGNGVTRQA